MLTIFGHELTIPQLMCLGTIIGFVLLGTIVWLLKSIWQYPLEVPPHLKHDAASNDHHV